MTVYLTNKEESAAIRNMIKLKYPGYKIAENSHGRGTACGWIHVTIIHNHTFVDDDQRWRISRIVYQDIKNAVGRGDLHDDSMTDYFCENILFQFYSPAEWEKRRPRKRVKQ
jgi:hypothetical protein